MEEQEDASRGLELRAFLFLTVVMAPVVAGLVVSIYGFTIWVYQMFAGPPTG